MSDLSDFVATIYNSKKTVVTKTHSSTTNADVTGNVGLELSNLEHTITDNVQSVVIVGTITSFIQGVSTWHTLNCWRNIIPPYNMDTFDHSTLMGGVTLFTGYPNNETKSASFILVDNNVGDSTAMTYKWSLKLGTGNSQNRSITIKYLTNPLWDLRDL